MLPIRDNYSALRGDFRWDIPQRFNLAEACCRAWTCAADKTAIINIRHDGSVQTWSYQMLDRRASQLANVFVEKGIRPGDRVALLLPQVPETAIVHLAAWICGAVTVPMAVLFGPDALEYRIEDSGASLLVTNQTGLAKVAPVREHLSGLNWILNIDGAGPGCEDLNALADAARDTIPCMTTGPDDPAVMVYTSGTTGPPKGALHGHRVLLGHLPGVQTSHEFLPQENDRFWTPADWAWAGGLFNVLLPGLYFGIPVVANASEKFDPEAAFRLMADQGIRNAFIPPTALKMLRSVPDPAKTFELHLRTVGSGGEALGRETLEWGRSAFGLTINEFYGQTECNYVLSSCAAIGVSKPGWIGKAVPGHEVAIIDTDGRVLDAGAQGQIAIKAPDPVMFLSYWQNPKATREKFIGDWLTTGDQGICDDEGYIRFVGRDDDVITSAGYRIGPGEIEDCLIGHPAVRLAAVVGKPDPMRTEIVTAFVVAEDGYAVDEELADDISAFVRERLSAHEYPREVRFVASIPLTTSGKVIRRHFKDQMAREAGKAQGAGSGDRT